MAVLAELPHPTTVATVATSRTAAAPARTPINRANGSSRWIAELFIARDNYGLLNVSSQLADSNCAENASTDNPISMP